MFTCMSHLSFRKISKHHIQTSFQLFLEGCQKDSHQSALWSIKVENMLIKDTKKSLQPSKKPRDDRWLPHHVMMELFPGILKPCRMINLHRIRWNGHLKDRWLVGISCGYWRGILRSHLMETSKVSRLGTL